MMCDIMPTISEDPPEIQYSQNEETNFEQLMVNMLDERDKLMETLRETQDTLSLTRSKLNEAQKERENIMAHLETVLSEVILLVWPKTSPYEIAKVELNPLIHPQCVYLVSLIMNAMFNFHSKI